MFANVFIVLIKQFVVFNISEQSFNQTNYEGMWVQLQYLWFYCIKLVLRESETRGFGCSCLDL